MVICLERSANDLHMVQPMPLPSCSLALLKSWIVLPFWCQFTQIFLEKKPLNGYQIFSLYFGYWNQEGKTRRVNPIWINWSKIVSGSGISWAICKSAPLVVKVDQRIRWHYSDYTITILCFCIGARQHEVSKLYGTLALSAGTLMASDCTLNWLVLAHFYPCAPRPRLPYQYSTTRSFLQAGCPSCHPSASKYWRQYTGWSKKTRPLYIFPNI